MAKKYIGISWRDKLTNEEIRGRTGQQTIGSILTERRTKTSLLAWTWMDHQLAASTTTNVIPEVLATREDQADQEQIGEA